MAENEEVVMTPLLAPEGVTVLKVERVSRGLLDPRTVHYVAGGRYKGIIINRAAKERPEHRTANVRRNFTCYIGAKLRGEPTREQRQLRFWFRHGSSDMEPMADRFFKELINPHLFPRDYIGYVKRILQLLQGYPTVAKMELEMRPARPDEEDQQYVVRRVSRQRSQPPPGIQQDDYHTWHAPPKAGSRGELGSPVDFRAPVDGYRVYTSSPRVDRKGTTTWRRHEETSHHGYSLTSRSPSPAKVVIRKLPPSPVVTRVKSSPVTIRHTTTQMPVVTTTHTRVLNPPVVSPPQPAHPGLSRRGVQVLWVARRYRVLKLLEDAYPNSVTADELLRYYKIHAGRSTRLVDVVALTSILKWLSIRGLVREVEPGQWMRLETVRTTGHNKWTHSTQMVTELPTLPHMELPQVAIVTLMYAEKLAVDAMIENKKTYVWRRPHDKGEGQVITLGNIGHVRVVSTKLPKPGEGESSMMVARNATSRVIGSFTSVSRVLLVGVAGGIAHFTDDRRHIRRGDIVVCKPKQSRAPMYIYCTGTERSVSGDYRFASRNWVTKDETLENLINSYQIRQRKDSNFCPWERHIREGLVLLQGGDIDFRRPELTTDRLVRFGSDGRPHEVPHPAVRSKSARDLRPGQPMVHYDVIGGGEALLGDYNKRRTFAMLTGAKAIDIGYQPVLEAIEEAQKDSVAIIRGIADYNDGRSDSYWQPYSALAAAAFTKALLLELPVEK